MFWLFQPHRIFSSYSSTEKLLIRSYARLIEQKIKEAWLIVCKKEEGGEAIEIVSINLVEMSTRL